jgi:hypothetical protein
MRRDRLTTDKVATLLIDQRTRSPDGDPGYITAVTSLVKLAKSSPRPFSWSREY